MTFYIGLSAFEGNAYLFASGSNDSPIEAVFALHPALNRPQALQNQPLSRQRMLKKQRNMWVFTQFFQEA